LGRQSKLTKQRKALEPMKQKQQLEKLTKYKED
jgi:hypothetical protein